jgi:RNA polymerase sigma-70 factor (ECF subfamily)
VPGRLVDVVRAAHPEREIPDELDPLLAASVARAAAAWPGFTVDAERFVAAIAARLADGVPPARALEAMQVDDLYLACGCAVGEPAALAGFEQRCGTAIERAIAATGASAAERADLGQVVRQRLLVAPADGDTPRIAAYSARGPLAAWVRVVATREAARMLGRARREVADNDELAGLLADGDDPEIGYLKRLYRGEFKRAFQAAIEALTDRQRLLLRQHVLDGLSIDQLAALYGAHRSTTARWLEAARDAVLAGTQRELVQRLQLSRGELASVMRLIHSQLDVSLSRVLLGPATR